MKIILTTLILLPFILTGMIVSAIRIGFSVGWDFIDYHLSRTLEK